MIINLQEWLVDNLQQASLQDSIFPVEGMLPLVLMLQSALLLQMLEEVHSLCHMHLSMSLTSETNTMAQMKGISLYNQIILRNYNQ
jgi:hypothetical protein